MASKKQPASRKTGKRTGKQPIELQDLQRVQGGVTAEQAKQVMGGARKNSDLKKKD